MISWKDLSLPPKIIALLVAVILIALTLFFTYTFVYGRVTLSSPVADAFVFSETESTPQPLPLTIKRKPGKYLYVIGAPGKLNASVNVKVYAFLHRKITVSPPTDYSTEQEHFRILYNYSKESYEIVPLINFGPESSPQDHLASQWTTYQAYANEAIVYLKGQGADTEKLPIIWWAQEWWPDGRSIKLAP